MRVITFGSILFALLHVGSLDAQVRIAANVDTVVFSKVKIGFSRDAIVEIRDTSSLPVNVRSLTIMPGNSFPGEFKIITPSSQSFTIDSGSPKNILLRFIPTQNSDRSATLLITTDDGVKEIPLIGKVSITQPDIFFVPKEIDFGGHILGDIVDTTFLIIGGGIDSATIQDMNVANDNAGIYFQAYPKDIAVTFPHVMGPTDTLVMTAHFESFVPLGTRSGRAVAFGDVSGETKCEFKAFIGMPEMLFTHDVVDLGIVTKGSVIDTAVFLKSTGELPVSVTDFLPMTLFQPNFPSTPLTIAPNDSLRIPVHFVASASGAIQEPLGALAKVTLSGGKYRAVLIKALVIPQLLQSTFTPDIDISCAFDSVYTRRIILRDTGSESVTISKITTDSLFTFQSDVLPKTLAPGDSLIVDISYKHNKGETGTNTAIIAYYTSEYVIHRDTLRFTTHQETLPFTLELQNVLNQSGFQVINLVFDSTINPYSIERIQADVVISPADVGRLMGNSIDFKFQKPLQINSKWNVTSFPFQTYLTIFDSAYFFVTVRVPGEEGCILPSSQSLIIHNIPGCGDETLRRFMRGQPLIMNVLTPAVTSALLLDVSVDMNRSCTATIDILNVLGVVSATSIQDFVKGQNNFNMDITNLPNGMYLVRIKATDVNGNSELRTNKFLIKR